jgi:hypothetical protein
MLQYGEQPLTPVNSLSREGFANNPPFDAPVRCEVAGSIHVFILASAANWMARPETHLERRAAPQSDLFVVVVIFGMLFPGWPPPEKMIRYSSCF